MRSLPAGSSRGGWLSLLLAALVVAIAAPPAAAEPSFLGAASVREITGVPARQTQPAEPAGFEELLAKAKQHGTMLIIVGLALPAGFQAEGTLSAPAVAAQRAAIAATTHQLIDGLSDAGTQVTTVFQSIPYLAMRADTETLRALAASPLVASIEEDVPAQPSLASSTTHIGLPAVWASGAEGTGQAVVVLDTGIDTNHLFFGSRIVDGACFSNANGIGGETSLCPNGTATQLGLAAAEADLSNSACWNGATGLCGHGSLVAGTAAGGDDPIGFDGVARGAQIVAIQVYTRFHDAGHCGSAPYCVLSFTTDQLRALDYVYTTLRSAQPIASINMSLGSLLYSTACDGDSRKAAIDNLRSAGIATVVASGNNNSTNGLSAPACISTAVAVGGVTDSDNPPADRVVYNVHTLVDLLAPAQSITSSAVGGGYATASGTSFAAPHVAGAFALCKSVSPLLGVDQIEAILQQTGARVADQRSGGIHTRPRIQLDAAIAACREVNLWTGAVDDAWNNPANWSRNLVPDATMFVEVRLPANGRYPRIEADKSVRGLVVEPGARLNLVNNRLTVQGNIDVLGQLDAAGATVVLTGSPGQTITMAACSQPVNLQIGTSGSGPVVISDGNLVVTGNLIIGPDAVLDLVDKSLTVGGTVTNNGSLRQIKNVLAGTTQFLHITNAAGNQTQFDGLEITSLAAMGTTAVTVAANQICSGGRPSDVLRCYTITPATPQPATVRFYYRTAEANGNQAPVAWHWNGTGWDSPLAGSYGGNGEARWVQATAVSAYSTFGLGDYAPLAVELERFEVEAIPDHVLVSWETVSEIDNVGFNLYRRNSASSDPGADDDRPNPEDRIAFVPSQSPGSPSGASYLYDDREVPVGQTYWYWLEVVHFGGGTTLYGPVSVVVEAQRP